MHHVLFIFYTSAILSLIGVALLRMRRHTAEVYQFLCF